MAQKKQRKEKVDGGDQGERSSKRKRARLNEPAGGGEGSNSGDKSKDSDDNTKDNDTSSPTKSYMYHKGEAWSANDRTLLLDYYFTKHPMTASSWRDVAKMLGREEKHFRRIIKPRALAAQQQ